MNENKPDFIFESNSEIEALEFLKDRIFLKIFKTSLNNDSYLDEIAIFAENASLIYEENVICNQEPNAFGGLSSKIRYAIRREDIDILDKFLSSLEAAAPVSFFSAASGNTDVAMLTALTSVAGAIIRLMRDASRGCLLETKELLVLVE